MDMYMCNYVYIYNIEIDRSDREIDGWTDGRTDRQADIQTDRQIDR